MFAILGATGTVGFATARALRDKGAPVRAISRDAAKAERLREMGCEIAVADLQDVDALVEAIAGAESVQVVVPLRPQLPDPAADLHQSIQSLMDALRRVGPKRLLAISDYGAHVAHDIGMPSVFHQLERRLRQLEGHKIVLRSAEHIHNWARALPASLASGTLASFQDPVEMAMPTIAAQDLGRIAADLLQRPDVGESLEIIHAEGPCRYSASDVAAALGTLVGRTIRAEAVPRAQWAAAFAHMPPSLADLLIKTNDAKNKRGLIDVEAGIGEIRHGTTELLSALRPIIPSP